MLPSLLSKKLAKLFSTSVFVLKSSKDTGNILLQQRVSITEEDNAGTIHDKLMNAGASLLVKTVQGLADGTITEVPQPQDDSELKHAPKIFKEDMRIDWQKPVVSVHNLVRGLSPYPGAFTILKDKTLKIYKSHYELTDHDTAPGTFDTDHKSYLRFATADGWLYADEVQQEGKKKMDIEAFLRGFRS